MLITDSNIPYIVHQQPIVTCDEFISIGQHKVKATFDLTNIPSVYHGFIVQTILSRTVCIHLPKSNSVKQEVKTKKTKSIFARIFRK